VGLVCWRPPPRPDFALSVSEDAEVRPNVVFLFFSPAGELPLVSFLLKEAGTEAPTRRTSAGFSFPSLKLQGYLDEEEPQGDWPSARFHSPKSFFKPSLRACRLSAFLADFPFTLCQMTLLDLC